MKQNRVWIELDPPFEKGKPADHELGHQRAARLTAMLARLMAPGHEAPRVKWNPTRLQYEKMDTAMMLQGAEDHGFWFNLDYMGRDA